ncbi:MAG: FliG C-terminal domain-containing protein [Parvularculaceae bacterium]
MANALQKAGSTALAAQTGSQFESWFTRAHKAAIVLASLSAETASAIVEELSDEEMRIFAKAFADLKTVSPQLLETVASEFMAQVRTPESNDLTGGEDEARRVLGMMTTADRAERVLDSVGGGGASQVWTRIERVGDETLAEYVQAQRKPIAAAILAKLNFEKTAAVLNLAEDGFARAIVLEIAQKQPPSGEALDAIAAVLEEDLLKSKPGAAAEESEEGDGEGEADAGGGSKPAGSAGLAGEIINNLPSAKRDAYLEHLKATDAELYAAVRKGILTFEELYARMPASGATALLRDVDRDVLLRAIKYGETNGAETVEFLFGNISKRMVEQYKEELAGMEVPSETDGEAAQREMTNAVRALVKAGEFKLIALKEEDAPAA